MLGRIARHRLGISLLVPVCCIGAAAAWMGQTTAVYEASLHARMASAEKKDRIVALSAELLVPPRQTAFLVNLRYLIKKELSPSVAATASTEDLLETIQAELPLALEQTGIAAENPQRSLVDLLEPQELALCLGIRRPEEDRVIAATTPNSWPLRELRGKLHIETNNPADIWDAARKEVALLFTENRLSPEGAAALWSELKALPRLAECGLSDTAFLIPHGGAPLPVWFEALREELHLSGNGTQVVASVRAAQVCGGHIPHGTIAYAALQTLKAELLDERDAAMLVKDDQLDREIEALGKTIRELETAAKPSEQAPDPQELETLASALPEAAPWLEQCKQARAEKLDVDKDLAALDGTIETLQAHLSDPKSQILTTRASVTRLSDPEEIAALKRELIEKRHAVEELMRTRTELHPQVKAMQAEITGIQEKILLYRQTQEPVETETTQTNPQLDAWRHELESLRGSRVGLHKRMERAGEQLAAANGQLTKIIMAWRSEKHGKRLDDMKNQLTEKTGRRDNMAASLPPLTDMVVLGDARAPAEIVFPIREQVLGAAAGIGVFLSLLLYLFLSGCDQAVRTAEDLRRHANLAVLGTVPRFSAGGRSGRSAR